MSEIVGRVEFDRAITSERELVRYMNALIELVKLVRSKRESDELALRVYTIAMNALEGKS